MRGRRAGARPPTCAPVARPSWRCPPGRVQWRASVARARSRRVGAWAPGERRLQQALRDEIGVAAVGRGRVRVVADGEAEVAVAAPPGTLHRRTRREPSSLTTDEREVGEAQRVRLAPAVEERLRAPRRRARQAAARRARAPDRRCAPSARASAARVGATGSRASPRKRAVTPLAAIMKSSISSLARFFSSGRRSASRSPSNTARVSMVSRSSAPCSWRRRLQRLGDAVLEAELLGQAADRGDRCGRRRPSPRARRPRSS